MIVRFRDEPIPRYFIQKVKKVLERKFIKAQSVFGDWRLDDATTLKRCLDHDMRAWKGSKFIKSREDL